MSQNVYMFRNFKFPQRNVKCDRTYLLGFSKQNLIDRVSKKGDLKDIKSYTISIKSNLVPTIKSRLENHGVCPNKLMNLEGYEAYIIVPNRNMSEEQEIIYDCIPTHEYYFYMQLVEAKKSLALIYDYCYDTINTQTFKAVLFQGAVDGDVSL